MLNKSVSDFVIKPLLSPTVSHYFHLSLIYTHNGASERASARTQIKLLLMTITIKRVIKSVLEFIVWVMRSIEFIYK